MTETLRDHRQYVLYLPEDGSTHEEMRARGAAYAVKPKAEIIARDDDHARAYRDEHYPGATLARLVFLED